MQSGCTVWGFGGSDYFPRTPCLLSWGSRRRMPQMISMARTQRLSECT